MPRRALLPLLLAAATLALAPQTHGADAAPATAETKSATAATATTETAGATAPATTAAPAAAPAAPAATPAAAAFADDDGFGEAADISLPIVAIPFDTRAANLGAFAAWCENDLAWSDKYYTSGIRFAYTTPEVFRDSLPTFLRDLTTFTPLATPTATNPVAYRLHFGFTHEFYTAKDEHAHVPRLGDHPYVGMFYGTFGLSSETFNRLDSLEISLGITGPSARAQHAQNGWHRVIDRPLINGWHTQTHDEPLAQFAWTRAWRFNWLDSSSSSLECDWLPRLRLEGGTARTYAEIGWQWRLGWGLPKDFGVTTAHDSLAFTRPARDVNYDIPISWKPDSTFFFFDFRGQYCARDTSLDGNIWYDGYDVHRYPWRGEIACGVATRWGPLQLSIQEVIRSKEFRGQDREVFVYTSATLRFVF
jgi:hypothetical protein